jgi:hypothetical protein
MGLRIPVVAEGAGAGIPAVNGNGVQLLIDFDGKMRRKDLLLMLDALKDHIIEGRFPPS